MLVQWRMTRVPQAQNAIRPALYWARTGSVKLSRLLTHLAKLISSFDVSRTVHLRRRLCMRYVLMALAIVGLAGCIHTETVREPARTSSTTVVPDTTGGTTSTTTTRSY